MFPQEGFEGVQEVFGTLDVGQVAAVRDKFEGASLEASKSLLPLRVGEYSIACSPQDKHRHLQARELIRQNLKLPSETYLGANGG